jgi:hypothetical protein
MLGILHCVAYQCGMNGSNSLRETDERPTAFCPECAAKIWWATRADPAQWYTTLAGLGEKQRLSDEARFWRQCADRLAASRP